MRGAGIAAGRGHVADRTGRGGARVDHDPAAEAGTRRAADGHRPAGVRDAQARAGTADRHGRPGVQERVQSGRQGSGEHDGGEEPEPTVDRV